MESRPSLLTLEDPDEALVVMELTVNQRSTKGDDVPGKIQIAIPARLVERLSASVDRAAEEELAGSGLPQARGAIEALLHQVPTNLGVELRANPITIADLVALRAGSVLDLGRPVDDSVGISVSGVPKFQGVLVDVGLQRAVQVTGPYIEAQERVDLLQSRG